MHISLWVLIRLALIQKGASNEYPKHMFLCKNNKYLPDTLCSVSTEVLQPSHPNGEVKRGQFT